MRRLDFKHWEWGLIALSLLLFLVAVVTYVTDYPLRNFLIQTAEEGSRDPVGRIAVKQGGLRREKHGEPEFRSIEQQEPVYDFDTIVTGSDGQATVELDDGGVIELSPSSMVQIRFDRTLSLGGITRQAAVEVVTGQVTGRSKNKELVIRSGDEVVQIKKDTSQATKPKPMVIRAPVAPSPRPKPLIPVTVLASAKPIVPLIPVQVTPSPSPIPPRPLTPRISRLVLTSPKEGTRLAPEWAMDGGKPAPRREVVIQWEVLPADAKVKLTLRRLRDGAVEMSDVVSAQAGKGRAAWTGRRPGSYEVSLEQALPEGEEERALPGAAKVTASARFQIEEQIQRLKLLEPLVGGEKASSNQLTGKVRKDFEILLRWEPVPGIDEYRISLRNDPRARAVMERKVDRPEFALNRDKVFTGKVFYEVVADLDSGFKLSSVLQPFMFDFLAPRMTLPADKSVLPARTIGAAGLLLVWQKTNFTQRYEVQVSRTSDFNALLAGASRTENFYVLKKPASGKYYWRVRSIAKNVSSPFSEAREFTITAK